MLGVRVDAMPMLVIVMDAKLAILRPILRVLSVWIRAHRGVWRIWTMGFADVWVDVQHVQAHWQIVHHVTLVLYFTSHNVSQVALLKHTLLLLLLACLVQIVVAQIVMQVHVIYVQVIITCILGLVWINVLQAQGYPIMLVYFAHLDVGAVLPMGVLNVLVGI